jgi:glycosyltransferase involved in cell wall biosynthesis
MTSHFGRRLRVVHVLARLQPAGTERQLVGMLREAHGRLWDASLVTLYPPGAVSADLDGPFPRFQIPSGPPWDPRRALALRRLVRDLRADLVHPSLWGASAFTRIALLGRRRPPIVMSERRVEDFRPTWARTLDRTLRRVTDGYIGNSVDVVNFIKRWHGVVDARVSLVNNGLDTEIFWRRRTLGSGCSPRRIGCVGRLVPEKGFDSAIKALPLVLEKAPVELLIAGQGPQRTRLRELAGDLPVRFLGQLESSRQVADFMRGLDVLVHPSHYEGLPNSVLEAIACGVPVVASDAPGVAEATGEAGLLVNNAADAHELSAMILNSLTQTWVPPEGAPSAHSFASVAAQHLEAFRLALPVRVPTGKRSC